MVVGDWQEDSELTMRDMATGTLLGTVSPASSGRRIARSAITNETAEFTDYWTACQWLREKYPIAPMTWPTGFGRASQQKRSVRVCRGAICEADPCVLREMCLGRGWVSYASQIPDRPTE